MENSDVEISEALEDISVFFGKTKIKVQCDSEGLHVDENEEAPLLDGDALKKRMSAVINRSYKQCGMTKICK